MLSRALAVFAVIVASTSALAQSDYTKTGNAFLPWCKWFLESKTDGANTQLNAGVCIGTVSTMVSIGQFLPPDIRYCVPPVVPLAQSTRVIVAYLEKNPSETHLDYITLSARALREAWPCR